MDFSIIIVNYKTADKTLKCLSAIKSADLFGIEYEIIVVDNNSKDSSAEKIRSRHPDILIVENKINSGMGSGNNTGVKCAKGEYVLILNPDTYLGINAIKKMQAYMKDKPEVGLVGPRLNNHDGSLQFTCMRFPKFYTPLLRRTFLGRFTPKYISEFLMKDFNHREVKEADWIMGSCLLIRKKIFDNLGGFDDRFFMYFEDTDLCRRIWQAGFKVVYFPPAEGVHDHGRGSADRKWYVAPFTNSLARAHIASWVKYFWKWGISII
jgi:N-acetylglucosaminyl-diphospho-decaprenol L-rhamnosyltransferase